MKGTCLVNTTIANNKQKVVLSKPDNRITPRAGLHLVAKLDKLLDISKTIDENSSSFKKRKRGLSLGSLMLSISETMLSGGDFLCDLDFQRDDKAGLPLRAVPDVPASTTVINLGKRFDSKIAAGLENANKKLINSAFNLLNDSRKNKLVSSRPTIDLDPTDVEVYGSKKEGTAYNYQGQLCYRPHLVVWAEAGLVLTGELGSGRDDPRPQAPSLIEKAVDALPSGLLRPIVRCDSGFFSRSVAEAALENNADFAIAAKRNKAAWHSMRKISEDSWKEAIDMHAEVAECDYVPSLWPVGTRTIVRRVRYNRDELSKDSRSRRRRTVDPDQLTLLEDDEIPFAYAYSFIVTNLDGDILDIESWFRQRALVEERIKDSKLGLALRHLPSGYEAVNNMWMWSGFFALNISAWLQAITGHDEGKDGRAHGKRLRRELISVAARITKHAKRLEVHTLKQDFNGSFGYAWRKLDALLTARSP